MPQSRPPRSFIFEPAKSTEATSNRVIKWFEKWLKLETPYVDPRSGINGIRCIKGGIDEYITMGTGGMNKYLSTFSRILKPDMFHEEVDIISTFLPNNKYQHPTRSIKVYKCSSYESYHSALVSGINREIIKYHARKVNESINDKAAENEEANLINVNDPQWLLIKQTREKMIRALFNYEIHSKINRNNKETNVLSVANVCRVFRNLDKLTKNMEPIVCIAFFFYA